MKITILPDREGGSPSPLPSGRIKKENIMATPFFSSRFQLRLLCLSLIFLLPAGVGTWNSPGAQILEEDSLARDFEPMVLTGNQLELLSQYTILNEWIF